jgi:UDP-N-acetylmuramyl pentapeptide phosphotransferase/UDP-N-acetylglucosamine-1-phosphate transferase
VRDVLTMLIAFALSVASTRWVIDWLEARAFFAVENGRTMHVGLVPQGGGAPVIATVIVVALAYGSLGWRVAGSLAVAAGLAILSAANDRKEIEFPLRLAAHFFAGAAALTLVQYSSVVFDGAIPIVLDRALSLLAIVWFINLYNFMDGIDGLAGVETLSIATGYLVVTTGTTLDGLALALIGASAGFLVWNWHKARIFLGDVGSIPLGFLLGTMMIQLATNYSLATAIILPLYYLTDATLTLTLRVFRGEKIWLPHRQHAYQRAARALGSHSAVVLRVAACNVVLIGAAKVAVTSPWIGVTLAILSVGVLMAWLEQAAARSSVTP